MMIKTDFLQMLFKNNNLGVERIIYISVSFINLLVKNYLL